ncbi:hypothetical protein DEO72_LG8g1041 [Vigna unguiculata]|uniref:Uncharacterized protein n=1 Tax=Vigna unguiculata TaxID=3917 RepID=A0A4D6MQJ9_VIGUN|nr:hypothetical protein DEO72_LG8g1041 [Vigna unguiculata]
MRRPPAILWAAYSITDTPLKDAVTNNHLGCISCTRCPHLQYATTSDPLGCIPCISPPLQYAAANSPVGRIPCTEYPSPNHLFYTKGQEASNLNSTAT